MRAVAEADFRFAYRQMFTIADMKNVPVQRTDAVLPLFFTSRPTTPPG